MSGMGETPFAATGDIIYVITTNGSGRVFLEDEQGVALAFRDSSPDVDDEAAQLAADVSSMIIEAASKG